MIARIYWGLLAKALQLSGEEECKKLNDIYDQFVKILHRASLRYMQMLNGLTYEFNKVKLGRILRFIVAQHFGELHLATQKKFL